MPHSQFSLTTSQCHKTTILRIVFKNDKSNSNWPGIVQQPVNVGSHKLCVKTAGPSADNGSY